MKWSFCAHCSASGTLVAIHVQMVCKSTNWSAAHLQYSCNIHKIIFAIASTQRGLSDTRRRCSITLGMSVQVTVSRRGLRNQLKTFLFRSKSNAAADTPRAGATPSGAGGSNQYGAATTEGQMRQLADLAFVMQDYETAQSTLKLLAGDYKTDKAFKHLAGVQVPLLSSETLLLCAWSHKQTLWMIPCNTAVVCLCLSTIQQLCHSPVATL